MAPIIHTEKLRKVYAVGKERVIALNNEIGRAHV